MDGVSVLSLLKAGASAKADRSFLIEYHGSAMRMPLEKTSSSEPSDEAALTGPIDSACRHAWSPGMACWTEGHEKMPPGPFSGGELCSCQDATNNTYACVRM